MRWISWRGVVYLVLLTAATASVYAAVSRREPPRRYMNVGGVNNPCTCTQRLER